MSGRGQAATAPPPALSSVVDLIGCFAADPPDPALLPDRCFAVRTTADHALAITTTIQTTHAEHDVGGTLHPGDVLDRYRIDRELGRGGQAVVYRAEHLLLHTPVAIKILFRHDDDAGLEALCEEARFAAMVAHPNVVRILDVVRDRHRAWIVMEYIDGPSLAGAIGIRGRLDPLTATEIAIDACRGLSAAFDCGLIHRDVKPGNLLLRCDHRALLADFGLARSNDHPSGDGPIVAGTPAYMAPEQVSDPMSIDHRADIYALGATLFHAVTGQPPFTAEDPLTLMRKHCCDPVPDPRTLVPDLVDELAEVILSMLAKDRAERPADYRELDQLLGQIRDELPRSGGRHQPSVFKRLRTWFQ